MEEISPKNGKCWKGGNLTKIWEEEKPKEVGEAETTEILIKYGNGKTGNDGKRRNYRLKTEIVGKAEALPAEKSRKRGKSRNLDKIRK